MPRPTTLFSLCLIACAILQSPASAANQEWIERETARYGAERLSLSRKEQEALRARQKAESARDLALRINDQKALPIAKLAMETADKALARIRSAMGRTESRLRGVERLRSVPGSGAAAVASIVRGTVEVKTSEGWRKLDQQRPLQPGEEIRTGADGYAEVMFDDGSRVNLHARTSFKLESEGADESSYRLSMGRIKSEIERLGNRRYSVRTPTAVAGVRGTEYLLEATEEGATSLTVLRGEVAFGPAGSEPATLVRKGEMAIVGKDGSMQGPRKVELRALQPWWEE